MQILVISCRNEHSGLFLWLRQQTIWPEGSLVRWWRDKKDSASTSRMSSDMSDSDEHRVHTPM